MRAYNMTVFDKTGKPLLDENFKAENDEKAKEISLNRLKEEDYSKNAYRISTSKGKLIMFYG